MGGGWSSQGWNVGGRGFGTGWRASLPPINAPTLTLDGINQSVPIGATGITVTSVTMRVKLVVDDQQLWTLQNSTATGMSVASGVVVFGGSLTVSNLTIDGTDYTSNLAAAGVLLNDNTFHYVSVTMAGVAASDFRIGDDGSGLFGNIQINDIQLNGGSDFNMPAIEGGGSSVHDISGNELHGVISNPSVGNWASTQTVFDNAYSNGFATTTCFDGSTDYFTKGSRLTTGVMANLSVAAWVCTTATGDMICSENDVTSQNSWYLFIAAGGLVEVQVSPDGGIGVRKLYRSVATVNDLAWHHVAMTFAANDLKLYVDGSEETPTKAIDGTVNVLHDTTAPFQIGAWNVTPALYFDGRISGVVIEQVTWSAATVASLYAGIVPATAWYFRDGSESEVNQGISDLTIGGTPETAAIPVGAGLPKTQGPGTLPPNHSFP